MARVGNYVNGGGTNATGGGAGGVQYSSHTMQNGNTPFAAAAAAMRKGAERSINGGKHA